ncbi:MAG: C69 family dipeptidase [Rikenellaceae bacterium]
MKIKKLIFLAASLFFCANLALGQTSVFYVNPDDSDFTESCTSIMVGKDASTDGSVMTAHTCDSNYRTWLEIAKRKSYKPGDTEPVYWGTLHTEEPWDKRNVTEKGRIPAVTETFAYLNTAYPCLNEKQLAIGETTINGNDTLVNKNGLFLIEELERIALQRCTTARDAIKLIGKMAELYGYGDSGECLTVADKKEVWQLEIYGSGPGKPGSIWVAQRIPDNHVGISANIPRISVVNFDDPNNFLFSSDIKERTKKLGLWDGKAEFIFWKIVSKGKPFSIREYFVFNTLAPSLGLKYDSAELPFSVKPDKKVSVRDIMALYRQTYDGTEWDQTKNLSVEVTRRDPVKGEYKELIKPVSNFMSNDMRALLNNLKPGATERVRGIAVIQCSYSHIIQLRDWLPDEVGGVAYFAFDNPAQSPRIPIYSGVLYLPASFGVCGQHRYREDAAIWSFRESNRIATINWDRTRGLIEPQVKKYEDMIFDQALQVEENAAKLIKEGKILEAKEYLTNYTNNFASLTMKRWQELKAELWTIFARSM